MPPRFIKAGQVNGGGPRFIGAGGAVNTDFITTWTGTAAGTLTVPTTGTGYNGTVTWEDSGGVIATGTFTDVDMSALTVTTPRTETVTCTISGTLPRIYFNNGGDKTKILTVENWGDVGATSALRAFYGCANLTTISGAAWNVPSWEAGLRETGISTLPAATFADCTLTQSFESVCFGCTNLTTIYSAGFANCGAVTTTRYAFGNTSLADIPSGLLDAMVLLATADSMFYRLSAGTPTFTQLPTDLLKFNTALLNLNNFARGNTSLVTVSSGVFEFQGSVTTYNAALFGCTSLVNFQSGINIASVTTMANFMTNSTINTTDYNALLVDMEGQTEPTGIAFHGGNSVYSINGAAAHDTLTGTSTWTITDGGCDSTCDFTTTWSATSGQKLTIPHTGTGYSFDIDWGDGETQTGLTEADAPFTKPTNYASTGTVTITISGTFPRLYMLGAADLDKITAVTQWGWIGTTSAQYAFRLCSNLTSIPAGIWDATSFESAFQGVGLTSLPANLFGDNPSCTTCFQMFYNSTSIATVGANAFSGLTACSNFSRLFYLCSGLTTTPSNIFTGCVGMTDIGEGFALTGMTSVPNSLLADQASLALADNLFNQAAVTTIGTNVFHASAPLSTFFQMFYNCGTINASDVGDWPIASVTNMTSMFFGCTINTTDYNAMLVGWEAQTEQTGVTFHGGSSTHSGAGTTARGVLTGTSTWSITDGGAA